VRPPTSPGTTGCYPIDDEGGCYKAGEYCRDGDHGTTGRPGNGETISGRPWAIEVKDQYAAGGDGQYLRDGISQAVLYLHFIRSAWELEEWFSANHL
jgi:hypothetical protein